MLSKKLKQLLPLCLLVQLTGCFQPVEELYHLPMQSAEYEQLTGEIASLRSALELNYTGVEYANILSGDNTSTIQLQSLYDDGEVDTAITFFRVPGAEEAMKIFILSLDEEGNYHPHCIIEGQGTSILSVEYADLNGSGKDEIIVNWQNNQLGVYSLDDTPNLQRDPSISILQQIPQANELLSTSHSNFVFTDLDDNGTKDLAVVRLDTAGSNSFVELYHWADGAFVTHSIAQMSNDITSLSALRANFVTGNVPALYISSNLIDNSRTTDIFVLKDGRLSNLTLDLESGISTDTLRDYRDIAPTDINNDGILEIPDPVELPSYEEEDSTTLSSPAPFWLIDWTQYNARGTSSPVITTYHNITDSWYLIIPPHWQDQITISRDDSIVGQRTVIFSRWNGAGSAPTPFLAIYKLTGSNRFTRATLPDRFELGGDSNTVYVATFFEDSWDCGLNEQDLVQSFHQIISSWA